ncbi:MAG: radical SAM protein [Selenomonadaceae bacterium]|nr:radical SAM protein [Selenomonadaceae bacterium]
MQIILKLTTDCNLACSYCSEGNQKFKRLSPEFFNKLVKDLPDLLTYIGDNSADFLFHGGEPMLYGMENLRSLMNFARENLSNLNLNFLMQTNGTLIDDEWIKFFDTEQIGVGISLDGYPEIHNSNRCDKNGNPTAQKILNNIRKMRESNLNVGILMVVTKDLDAERLFKFIQDNDLNPKIHPVVPCGRAANRTDSIEVYESYVEIMKKLLKLSLLEENAKIIDPLDEILNAILGISPMHECAFGGTCGKNFICLYPDGEVGFCGRDNLARFLTYGNIQDSTLLELYESDNAIKIRDRQKILRDGICQKCSDWNLCHGGCAFEAVNSNGNLNSKYPLCEYRRKFLAWLKVDGLKLLKSALVKAKKRKRESIKMKRHAVNEIESMSLDEVLNRA